MTTPNPPAHDEDPHPEMSEGLLDDEQVEALFKDYRACVEIDEIIVKAGPGPVDEAASRPTLEEVHALITGRAVRGIQIRYRFESAHWLDTLMPAAEGVRLIRIRHAFEA